METLQFYYKKYFEDISQVEYIDIIPFGEEILIQEQTIGIPFKVIQQLFPICSDLLKDPVYEDMASWVLLFLSGEHNTAWNIRLRLKQQRDLKLTQLICIRYPGSSISFHHRLQLEKTIEEENEFFLKAYRRKNRSYHLFTYRLKYITQCFEDSMAGIELIKTNGYNYREEIEMMKSLAEKDVHNFSLFNHIYICARRCNYGMERLKEWALNLRGVFEELYRGQISDGDVDQGQLQSLNQFIKYL